MSWAGRLPGALLDLLALAFCAFFAQGSLRELFTERPSAEKIADVVIFAAATVGVGAAVLRISVLRDARTRRTAATLEAVSIVTVVASLLWVFNYFFAHVGPFG